MTTEQITQHAIEQTAINVSGKATVFAGLTAFFGGMTVGDVAAIGGLMLALAGFCVSLFFNWRRDRREAHELQLKNELHQLQVRELAAQDRRVGLPDPRREKSERRHQDTA